MLLRANNHAGAHEAHVCDNLVGSEAMLVDQICANEAAGSSKTSLAMDSDSLALHCDHLVCEVDKLANQTQRRAGTVVKDHVQVLNAQSLEVRG